MVDRNSSGVGLALSGGGFRATLFGLGALCRLNDMGYLPKLNRIAGVSGGSILAGYLGFKWSRLNFDAVSGIAVNFAEEVTGPLREFCNTSVDVPAGLKGLLRPFKTIGDYVASKYDKALFRKGDGASATLQDLPADGEGPRFILLATSLQTRANVRFSRPYIADFNLGRLMNPDIKLSVAVGASSAFPPALSPVILETNADQWIDAPSSAAANIKALRSKLILTDGGVYDNLGLEPLWGNCDTILVSDAGAPADIDESVYTNWLAQLTRVRGIMMEQTRALRRRMLITDLEAKRINGAFWGIATLIDRYELPDAMLVDSADTGALQRLRTRLNPFSEKEQGQLINWGYALCDAAMRKHMRLGTRPTAWPIQGAYGFPMKQ